MKILLLLFTMLVVSEVAYAIAPEAPFIFVKVEPISQDIQAGSSATFIVSVVPQATFNTANVTLSLVDPPQGVTATFSPDNKTLSKEEGFSSTMTVKVAADAAQGKQIIKVRGAGNAFTASDPTPQRIDSTNSVTLNITAPITKTIPTTLTTSTTITVSTTLSNTITSTSTERVTDSTTYAWAVSATVAAVVLAVVLMLQRRPR